MIKINNKKLLVILISLFILVFSINFNIIAQSDIYCDYANPYYNTPALNKADQKFEINFSGYGKIGNNAINSEYLNKHLNEEDKDEILSNIDKNGELVILGDGKQNFNVKYKNFTFFTGLSEITLLGIPKDAIEILLKGNELEKEYNLEGTKGELALYTDTGLSYSFKNKSLAKQFNAEEVRLGGSVHYLSGGIAKLTGEGSFILNYEDTITGSGKMKAEYAEEATGYAIDFGLNTKVNDKLAWSASISNIGTITADKASYYEYSYDPIKEKFTESTDQPLDNLKYDLPLTINFGTKYRWKANTNLIGGYSLTSYSTGYSNHKISGGIEYNRIKFLPVSFGVTYSSLQGSIILSSGAALKLGPMYANVTFSDLQALFNGSKSVSLGISTGFSF